MSCYINTGSNHPKQVFKTVHNDIMTRLSSNFSNIGIFIKKKGEYQQALKNSCYTTSLVHKLTLVRGKKEERINWKIFYGLQPLAWQWEKN